MRKVRFYASRALHAMSITQDRPFHPNDAPGGGVTGEPSCPRPAVGRLATKGYDGDYTNRGGPASSSIIANNLGALTGRIIDPRALTGSGNPS